MSLRLKTIVGVALIEAVLLLMLVTLSLDYLRTTNYEALIKRATTTSNLFVSTTKAAVISHDLASLQSFADEFLLIPDIVYVRIADASNRVFAQAGDDLYLSRPFSADYTVEGVSDGVFDSRTLIAEGGTEFARIDFGIDIAAITGILSEAKHRTAMVALVEILLVALFSLLLGTYLTRQLVGLKKAAKAIAWGDLDVNVPVKGNDEIAHVARAFNAMTANLKEASERRRLYESDLREFNHKLEQRVTERTSELVNKNIQLEQANRQIKDAQGKLLNSEKLASVGLLAAGVAHEINNPMSFIMSNLRTLQHYIACYQQLLELYQQLADNEDEKKQELEQQIQRLEQDADLEFINEDILDLLNDSIEGSVRVRDIVAGLKEFSRVDSQDSYLLYDINDCIRSTLRVSINEIKYHCEVKTDLQELPQTCCQPGQLNQVFLNLLVNAGQAITEMGVINLRSRVENDQIVVEVEDSGTGIEKDKLDKIFDPFFTTKPVGEGTGLGLAISYGIVTEHGGTIEVESGVGQGTCFRIRLPINHEPPKQNAIAKGKLA